MEGGGWEVMWKGSFPPAVEKSNYLYIINFYFLQEAKVKEKNRRPKTKKTKT